jgi:putative transposase
LAPVWPWLERGLKAAGLKLGELAAIKGSDPRKVLLADQLWRRTVVSQEWLAQKLAMKSAANVGQQLRRVDRSAALKKVPQALADFLKRADLQQE